MTAVPARIVVLASGGGRTLENLQERIREGDLPARIVLVIVSQAEAGARERAQRLGLPCLVIGRKSHTDDALREKILLGAILEARPDWVVLAGWLQRLPIVAELEGRVLNIHPALLPAYGGQGFYGAKVHAAVADDAPLVSGCTVHLCDDHYDTGPVVLQEAVALAPDDDAEAIAAKVFEAEKRVLPEALRLLIAGRAFWDGEQVDWR